MWKSSRGMRHYAAFAPNYHKVTLIQTFYFYQADPYIPLTNTQMHNTGKHTVFLDTYPNRGFYDRAG